MSIRPKNEIVCLFYCQQDGYFDAINLFNNCFKYDYILDPKKDTNSIIVPKNLREITLLLDIYGLEQLYSIFSLFKLNPLLK